MGWPSWVSRDTAAAGAAGPLPGQAGQCRASRARGGPPLLRGAPRQPESVVQFAALVRVVSRRGRVSMGHGSRAGGPQAVGTPAADRARAGRGVGGRRGCLETARREERRRWSNGRAPTRRASIGRGVHSEARYGFDQRND